MTNESELHASIGTGIKALRYVLSGTLEEAEIACVEIDQNERNSAVGTLIAMEDMLDQAVSLLKGVIALHRLGIQK